MNDPLLELREVACERDDAALFAPLSLSLRPGEAVHVAGANGVGKTSLLRAVCGLSSRYRGDILWRGRVCTRPGLNGEAIYLGHSTGVKAALSPRDNLRWWCALRGGDADGIGAALERVGLSGYEDQPCYSLSAGQQRRVAWARLSLLAAPLWVLDEPLTAIDRAGVAMLEEWLGEHCAHGGMVLLTTHQPLVGVAAREVQLG